MSRLRWFMQPATYVEHPQRPIGSSLVPGIEDSFVQEESIPTAERLAYAHRIRHGVSEQFNFLNDRIPFTDTDISRTIR